MAKKNKKEVANAPVEPTVTVEQAAEYEAVQETNVPRWIVNCHRCGASLHVQEGNMVYMCPVCNNLFRVRKCEKLVKDVSRVVVAEAYVNVHKGKED